MSFYALFPTAYNRTDEFQQRVQILWGLFLAGRLRVDLVAWQGIEGEPVQLKRHTRRGDKYKKPLFTKQCDYYRNNNRIDRSNHRQSNKRLMRPRDKKY